MLRLKVSSDRVLVLSCTVHISAADYQAFAQSLNCEKLDGTESKRDEEKKRMLKNKKDAGVWYKLTEPEWERLEDIIHRTSASKFNLSALSPTPKGSSDHNLLFAEAIDDHNATVTDVSRQIDDNDLVNWVKSIAEDSELYLKSKFGKETGGAHDGREMHVFKAPMENLLKLGFDRAEVAALKKISNDMMYIKLDFDIDEPHPDEIDVTSYHRDSDKQIWDKSYSIESGNPKAYNNRTAVFKKVGRGGQIAKANRDKVTEARKGSK